MSPCVRVMRGACLTIGVAQSTCYCIAFEANWVAVPSDHHVRATRSQARNKRRSRRVVRCPVRFVRSRGRSSLLLAEGRIKSPSLTMPSRCQMWTTENRSRYDRSQLRYPSDLTDPEWALIKSLILPAKKGGNKRTVDERQIVTQDEVERIRL